MNWWWLQGIFGMLIGLLSCVGLVGVAGLIGLAHEKHVERRQKQRQRAPVNAIAENVTWRHDRRVEDRAKWDTDFYELEHRDDRR